MDDARKVPVRRSSSKSFKGLIRIFKPDNKKVSNMRIRIPSFRENRKRSTSSSQQRQQQQVEQHLGEPENLLKEIVSRQQPLLFPIIFKIHSIRSYQSITNQANSVHAIIIFLH